VEVLFGLFAQCSSAEVLLTHELILQHVAALLNYEMIQYKQIFLVMSKQVVGAVFLVRSA
jgi:hypothetical protein